MKTKFIFFLYFIIAGLHSQGQNEIIDQLLDRPVFITLIEGDTFLQRDLTDYLNLTLGMNENFSANIESDELSNVDILKKYFMRPHPSVSTTQKYFDQAANEFGVPVSILMVIGQIENNWTQTGPTIDQGWGIMHLVQNSYCNTLQEAAQLIGVSEQILKDDARQNIRGAAALIAKYARDEKTNLTKLEDWFPALAQFSGLISPELRDMQANTYFETLKNGVKAKTVWGEEIIIDPQKKIELIDKKQNESNLDNSRTPISSDYGPALTNMASSCNYASGRTSNIDTWVNHYIGTGTYLGTISWFQTCPCPNNPNCTTGNPCPTSGYRECNRGASSAHFVIKKSNGEITQMVAVANTAWHCGATGYAANNPRSIGVEHEAVASDPTSWNSTPMLNASATMACYFKQLYGFPSSQNSSPGICGHSDMPGTSTACPGPLPWATWYSYFNSSPGCSSVLAPGNDECPGAYQLTVSSSCNYTPGTTIGATSTGFTSCSGNMNDDDVFYNFSTGSKTSVTIQVNSLSNFDAAVQVLTGPCSLSMYQVPNGCIDVTAHGGLESRTFTGLSTNTTYYIRIGSYDAGSSNQGNFQVCVFGNEECTNWSVSPTSANYTSSGGSGSFSVYASGSCTFSAASSVSWINNIYFPGSGVVEYDVDANPNCSSQTGYVNIYDENNVLKVAHTVNQSGLPSVTPTISISPSPNTTVCSGNPLSFTSTITNGGITPSYQWFLNGNQVGTNSTYTTPSLTSNSTVYCKLTSNANCANPATVNSSTTTITVTPLVVPTISISPSPSTTVCSGNSVSFTSTITNGGSTPTYQWYLNGTQVGTNSTYTTPSLSSNSNVYCKLTSNANCASPATVTSLTTTITVTPPVVPTISISPSPSTTVCSGNPVSFTSTITNGGSPPTYQWFLNGNQVGTNSTYTTPSLTSNSTVYCKLTSNANCANPATVNSSTTSITVNPVPGTATINGPNSGTAGVAINFTASSSNASIYNWTAPSDWTPTTGVGQSFSSTPGSSGNVTVTPSNDCGIGPQGNLFVTIPNSVFVLTINSQNPSAGVNITVTPNDNNGSGDGTTPLTRSYYQGTGVTLTAPPSANGNSFSKWLKNNADFSTNHQIPVTVTANDTYTAVYSNPPCSLSVTPPTQNVPAIGGSVSFNVSSLSGCNWTVVSNKTWCVVSPSTGSGIGNFTATCTQNTSGTTQTANITITIAGITPVIVAVTQSGACTPPWQVVQNQQFNMSVIAKLYISNELTLNPADAIGAFVGSECRGIGYPDPNLSGIIFLTISSNNSSGETIIFKAWKSEQCEECPVGETMQFENQAAIGTIAEPFEFHCGFVELCINFGAGYTWFSVNTDPGAMTLNSLFDNIEPCENDRIISQQSFAVYYGTSWVGTLSSINPTAMYKMKICTPQTWCKQGAPVGIVPITIDNGYPWIGYLPQSDLVINTALDNMIPEPVSNDRFNGQSSFATYSGSLWVGSLSTLQKGKGYIIHLANPSVLSYPTGTDDLLTVVENTQVTKLSPTWDDPKINAKHNMQVIGKILLPDGNSSVNANDIVYSYVGDECRGIGNPVPELGGRMFLTIGSDIESGEKVTFKIFLSDENYLYEASNEVIFTSEMEAGTMAVPYEFDLKGFTGIPLSQISQEFNVGEVYPNPFDKTASMEFKLDEPGKVEGKIINGFGSIMQQVINQDLGTGSYELELNGAFLPTGLYSLLMTYTNDHNRFVILKKLIIK